MDAEQGTISIQWILTKDGLRLKRIDSGKLTMRALLQVLLFACNEGVKNLKEPEFKYDS